MNPLLRLVLVLAALIVSGGYAVHVYLHQKTEFEAKMAGSIGELKKYYEHPEEYIGKMLTVKYQGFTTKSKVPRFPVALRIATEL